MAFSYSDKNFTVIGNLCFVHIYLDGIQKLFDIPLAIADRMLIDNFICTYYGFDNTTTYAAGGGGAGPGVKSGYALINSGKIIFDTNKFNKAYLSFYFPIDSNK